MKYVIILLFSAFSFVQTCGENNTAEKNRKRKNKEFITLDFKSGPLAGTSINGTSGVNMVQQLKSIDSHSTNLLLGLDVSTISTFQLKVDHSGSTIGTFELGNTSSPMNSEGSKIRISGLDKFDPSAMTSMSGEINVTKYDDTYEGNFSGTFVDDSKGVHQIDGTFKVKI